ncbi:MAG: hypothetical protein COV44_04265 [Deltaproteobacteria bacterium CG11_big_fil_rev_8_21_14_0_20_45_16]|nr:MAG: hypothetical protein COV44_04265 [Deltaproteobacteria bacterium CG11_big_fil_rev_8_21_14_0_20_45_16]
MGNMNFRNILRLSINSLIFSGMLVSGIFYEEAQGCSELGDLTRSRPQIEEYQIKVEKYGGKHRTIAFFIDGVWKPLLRSSSGQEFSARSDIITTKVRGSRLYLALANGQVEILEFDLVEGKLSSEGAKIKNIPVVVSDQIVEFPNANPGNKIPNFIRLANLETLPSPRNKGIRDDALIASISEGPAGGPFQDRHFILIAKKDRTIETIPLSQIANDPGMDFEVPRAPDEVISSINELMDVFALGEDVYLFIQSNPAKITVIDIRSSKLIAKSMPPQDYGHIAHRGAAMEKRAGSFRITISKAWNNTHGIYTGLRITYNTNTGRTHWAVIGND